MSDHLGNTVDNEIWITSGLTKVTVSGPKDGSQKPLSTDVEYEYAMAYADGTVGKNIYDSEGEARLDLMNIRDILKGYGVDEEQWPILMKREVITTIGSWKILSV